MLVGSSKLWFKFIHSSFLIYNLCWEDVDLDLALLDLDSSSRVFTITSAGDNAITYLLSGCNSITTVDINPRQNYLLDLKLSLIRFGDYQLFRDCFVDGKSQQLFEVFEEIRPLLKVGSAAFWKKHLRYFKPNGNGLYFNGGAGYFARFLNRIINQKKLRPQIEALIWENSPERRDEMYTRIAAQLWAGKEAKRWHSDFVLGLAGIPASQRRVIGDLNGFMDPVLRAIFVKQNASKNPYWSKYLGIQIQAEFELPYLKKMHYSSLRASLDNLKFQTISVFNFLSGTPQTFTHFVLLDHMDWLAGHGQSLLNRQWALLLQRAAPKAKILFRTAHPNLEFLPNFVRDKVRIQQIDPQWIQMHDRVGTYTGTYLGTIE